MPTLIENMLPSDWEAVRTIYEEGMRTQLATFEIETPGWETWDAAHRRDCRLVARERGDIVGWAALSPISERCVYGGVAEVSVYVAASAWGRGVGKTLLHALVTRSEAAGLWTLQAGVFPENAASVALHRACGFRDVGLRERLGKLGDRWRDVLLMERRSERVGS